VPCADVRPTVFLRTGTVSSQKQPPETSALNVDLPKFGQPIGAVMKTFFILVMLVIGGSGAVWYLTNQPTKPTSASAATTMDPKAERKILFYQSPMHPWIKSDKPGQCTVCGMDLVPVYESGEGTNSALGLKLNADSVTVLDVQSVVVAVQPLTRTLRVAGKITANSWTAQWFEFTAYERDFAWLKIGQTMEITLPAVPGKTLTAKINLRSTRPVVDTEFDAASGSTKIRAEILDGPVELPAFGGKKLFNGIYAEGVVRVEIPEVLAVPRRAVLSPGAQALVYVDTANHTYESRKIKLGRVGDDFVEVLEGLKAGEKVVTRGNLLIDAETQISQSANQ